MGRGMMIWIVLTFLRFVNGSLSRVLLRSN